MSQPARQMSPPPRVELDSEDFRQRMSLARPEDTAKGMFFNGVTLAVSRLLDAEAARTVVASSDEKKFVDFFNYPIASFLKMSFTATALLERVAGGHDAAFRRLGVQATNDFLATTVGKTLLMLAGRDPKRLLSAVPGAFKTCVSYGERKMEFTGETSGTMKMIRDFMPFPYHEGVLEAVIALARREGRRGEGPRPGPPGRCLRPVVDPCCLWRWKVKASSFLVSQLLFVALPGAALAQTTTEQRVVVFRSVEDATVTPDLSVCQQAPFAFNVRLTASIWSIQPNWFNGDIVDDDVLKIGEAHACAQITTFTFPPGLDQNFYARFDLPDGAYTALGTCKLVTNDVPQTGLVLAGCSLEILNAPSGVHGGMATSASVFNPFVLPGFETGSLWTLHLYQAPKPPPWAHGYKPHKKDKKHGLRAMEFVEDSRSPAQVQKAKKAVGR